MGSYANDNKCTLFVGNIHDNVSEDIMFELFLQVGPIKRLSMPKDRNTGAGRGFGFVTFKHEVSVDYAINVFRDTKLFGRYLNIKRKQEKSTATPSKAAEGENSEDRFNDFQNTNRSQPSDFQNRSEDRALPHMKAEKEYRGIQGNGMPNHHNNNRNVGYKQNHNQSDRGEHFSARDFNGSYRGEHDRRDEHHSLRKECNRPEWPGKVSYHHDQGSLRYGSDHSRMVYQNERPSYRSSRPQQNETQQWKGHEQLNGYQHGSHRRSDGYRRERSPYSREMPHRPHPYSPRFHR